MPLDVDAAVLSNTRLTDDYNVLALAAPEIGRLTKPGQFVMVKPNHSFDPLLRRPFSVFEILRDASRAIVGISLLNKRVGVGTSMLFDANPGDRIACFGPLGRPFAPVDPPAEAWMVAGGVGLAPFVTLAEALAARGTRMHLFYGARSAADLYYADQFERMGATLHLATEDGSRGDRGRITVPLERVLASTAPSLALTLYVCGPTPMMRAVATLAASHQRPCFVSLEPVMGCGMGGCYSCVVPMRRGSGKIFVRACLEGPVFYAHALAWDALTVH